MLCPHKYGVDVFMDDQGFYRAECADCDWKSGRCFSEGEANQAASRHMSVPSISASQEDE